MAGPGGRRWQPAHGVLGTGAGGPTRREARPPLAAGGGAAAARWRQPGTGGRAQGLHMASPATVPGWAAAAGGAPGPVSAFAGQVERQGPAESPTAGLCRAGGLGSTGFSWRPRPAAATAGSLRRSQLQRQGLSQFRERWPSGPGLERSLAWGVPQPHRRPGPGGKPVPRAGGGLAPLAGRTGG